MISKIKALFRGRNVKKQHRKEEAAIQIQALFRGYRDRRDVTEYIEHLIAQMISKKVETENNNENTNDPIDEIETKDKTENEKGDSVNNDDDVEDDDDESIEEIILVLDSGSYSGDDDDDDDGETIIEIVTIVDSGDETDNQPPPSEFDQYNQQLKSQGKPSPTTGLWKKKPIVHHVPLAHEPLRTRSPPPKRKELTQPWMKKSAVAHDEASTHQPIPLPRAPSSHQPRPLPRAQKNALVNRYLAAATGKSDDDKLADIEADRARGRWKGSRNSESNSSQDDIHEERQQEQLSMSYGHPKPEMNSDPSESEPTASGCTDSETTATTGEEPMTVRLSFDETALIKLQALIRGVLARRKYSSPVVSPIDVLIRSGSKDAAEPEMEEEDEYEGYDETKGLPLWWMKIVPHFTKDNEDYERDILNDKKDNPIGGDIVEYRLFGQIPIKSIKNHSTAAATTTQPLVAIEEDAAVEEKDITTNDNTIEEMLLKQPDGESHRDELDFLPLQQANTSDVDYYRDELDFLPLQQTNDATEDDDDHDELDFLPLDQPVVDKVPDLPQEEETVAESVMEHSLTGDIQIVVN